MTFPNASHYPWWFWSKSSEWWIAFGTILLAVMTFVLALVTVFPDSIWSKCFWPRLSLKVESRRPCLEKNQWQNGVDVYWFRAEEGWWLELICKSLAIAC